MRTRDRDDPAILGPLPTICETCGGPLKKLLSAPAVQFKGSGFYLTDYGRAGSEADAGKGRAAGRGGTKSSGGEAVRRAQGPGGEVVRGSRPARESPGEAKPSGEAKTGTAGGARPVRGAMRSRRADALAALLAAALVAAAFPLRAAGDAQPPPPGGTWLRYPLPGAEVKSLVAEPRAPGVFYAGTALGGVYRSTDGGRSWSLAAGRGALPGLLSHLARSRPAACRDPLGRAYRRRPGRPPRPVRRRRRARGRS
ncbi:MAG: hypothetical protein M0C28_16135 [Candidatus Moduliflexus flocculans]|nr:hypothetical protein [Candidatus Moduliflexus flocculans]